jgi:hypothetical protein
MPNKDGSLTGSDRISLVHVLNRVIPHESLELAPGTLGILEEVQRRALSSPSTRSAFLKIVEALSLDTMAHAVGGFAALTEEEQKASLHSLESTLPNEFKTVLGLARDVYYEDERTPDRPKSFSDESEEFGNVETELADRTPSSGRTRK